MDFTSLIQLGGFVIALCGLIFSYHKWRESVVHGRIEKLKAEFETKMNRLEEEYDDRFRNIEQNYSRREEFSQLAVGLKEALKDIKEEQHRMSVRFDEFFMKFIETSISGNKKTDQ